VLPVDKAITHLKTLLQLLQVQALLALAQLITQVHQDQLDQLVLEVDQPPPHLEDQAKLLHQDNSLLHLTTCPTSAHIKTQPKLKFVAAKERTQSATPLIN